MLFLNQGSENDTTEFDDEYEQKRRQIQNELDAMVEPPKMFSTFNPDNFDESKIPIPLFTAMIVFLGSLYVTISMFYYGINGFPDDPVVPPV